MSAVTNALRSAGASLARAAGRVLDRAGGARQRRVDARARAVCPHDSWAFTPLYTDGACPLCGWVPEGYVYAPPLLTPYDRYWGALGGIAAVSVVMCVVVVVALTRA